MIARDNVKNRLDNSTLHNSAPTPSLFSKNGVDHYDRSIYDLRPGETWEEREERRMSPADRALREAHRSGFETVDAYEQTKAVNRLANLLEGGSASTPGRTTPGLGLFAGHCSHAFERGHNPKICAECINLEITARTEAQRAHEIAQAEKFQRAVSDELEPEEEAAILGRFVDYGRKEVLAREVRPDMVAGLIAHRGTINMLSGYRGSMKSLVTLSLAGAVAGGDDEILGLEVNEHGPVLYAYLEDPEGLKPRLAAWEDYHGRPMDGVRIITAPMDMKAPEDVQGLALLARRRGAVLIILDSVAKTGGGKEDGEDFAAYRAGIEALAEATDAAVLVLHNSGHDQSRSRGHTVLEDGMNSSVLLRPRSDREGGGIGMSDCKTRDGSPLESVALEFHPCGPINPTTGKPWSGVPRLRTIGTTLSVAARAYDEILTKVYEAIDNAATPGEATSQEIADALGVDKSNVSREMKPLMANGWITDNGGRTSAKRFTRGSAA